MGGMTKVATIIRLTTIHALLLLAAVILVPRLMAATPLKKVRLAYSAFAYANPPFWIAQENLTLTPSPEGVKFILDYLAEQRPALKGKNPADFIERKFLRKLEEEGFFKQFAAK